MTPEQTIDSLKVYQQGNQYMLLTIGANGVDVVSTPIPPIAKNTIESLQDTITQLQAQNANYKEQIKELVKQKHRREE